MSPWAWRLRHEIVVCFHLYLLIIPLLPSHFYLQNNNNNNNHLLAGSCYLSSHWHLHPLNHQKTNLVTNPPAVGGKFPSENYSYCDHVSLFSQFRLSLNLFFSNVLHSMTCGNLFNQYTIYLFCEG